MSKDNPLQMELLDSEGAPYLGSPEDIESIIRSMWNDAFERRVSKMDNEAATDKDRVDAIRFANMFLGRRELLAKPVEDWNKPGAIDAWVASKMGVDEKSPTKRMAGGYLIALGAFYDAVLMSENDAILDEQWEEAIEDAVHDFTFILIGTDPYVHAVSE